MEFSGRELHLWRPIVAVCWSVVVQFILLFLYIFVVNVDVWNFKVHTVTLFSVNSLYIILLAALIFFQGIVFSRNYLKPPKAQFINKRFILLLNLFTYQNLVAFCMYVTLGLSIFYVYASLADGSISSFNAKCNVEESNVFGNSCLNEKKLFLMCGGLFIGVYTFFKDYICISKTLVFPPIQQHKFVRIKTALFPCLKAAMVSSIAPSVLYCICYYLKGSVLRSSFSALSGLPSSRILIDTLFVLLDRGLLLYLWMFTTIYIFTLSVMNILLNIHLTERAYFPITTFIRSSAGANPLLMQGALSSEKIPVIQHLGFLDLALLSQFDVNRRAEAFTLSQPGGHPHAWNAIVNECFNVINKFTVALDICIDVSCSEENKKTEKPSNKGLDTSVGTCHQRSYNMRNLSVRPSVEYFEQSPTVTLQKSYERLIKVYQEWLNKKVDAFCKKPVIAYFFGEMTEPKIKHLLSQSQPVVWAVESLSLLICHSLHEDSFGIAQKDLSRIIVLLLNLKSSLDKLQKQSIFIKKSNKLDLVDIQMKNAVKFSVKQSIYRIAITFKDYIHDINLSPEEYVSQMKNFVEFKEV